MSAEILHAIFIPVIGYVVLGCVACARVCDEYENDGNSIILPDSFEMSQTENNYNEREFVQPNPKGIIEYKYPPDI